jgi:tagatose kinase
VMGSSLISPAVTAAIKRGVTLAKEAGAQISFDPNIRKELLKQEHVRDALRAILEVTDILLPSLDDLEYLRPGANATEAAHALMENGIKTIVLKRGKAGSTLFDSTGQIDIAPVPANEIDPTGAGDCFGGTFIACLTLGFPARESVSFANAALQIAWFWKQHFSRLVVTGASY